LSPLYFTMIWDIDLVCGMRVYNNQLHINFEFHSGWMIFYQLTTVWALKFGQYLVVTTFFSLCLNLLTWFMVYECIVMNNRSKLIFRSGVMIFGRAMALGLWNWAKYLVVIILFHYVLKYWIDFWHDSVWS
jgi:hypothetical protein